MMLFLRSFAFNVAFFGWTGVVATVLLLALMMPRVVVVRAISMWVRGVLSLQRIVGQRVEIRGHERVPTGPVLIASKHQSAWDTLIFNLALNDPSFVLKKELYRIPAFGWELRHAGMIPIDRRGGAVALKEMVRTAKVIAASGRPIVIFPEGTRMAPGHEAPYHPGVAALYRALNLAVVPVALNSGQFWPRRGFLRYPGILILEFQPPIPAGLERRVFVERLRYAIETASAGLRAPAQPLNVPSAPGRIEHKRNM
jgi:1-acyl-sn-glycerol-3-phosphate acyltransferase